jgi:hypothetical protein
MAGGLGNSSTVSGTACWPISQEALSVLRVFQVPWSRLLSGTRSL